MCISHVDLFHLPLSLRGFFIPHSNPALRLRAPFTPLRYVWGASLQASRRRLLRMSTPCEKLGYEEGMQFTLVNDDVDGLSAGDTLWLHSDDGSSNPEFRNTEKVNDDTETYYIDLICVARYTEDETLAYNRGLREGDTLQMVMDNNGEEAYVGDIITFIKDDGDTCPQFEVAKDGNRAYLYLSHVGGLEPKLGRKVRVIHDCTAGFSAGTEGIIVEICSDGDYCIAARGDTMYHHADSCLVFGYAEDELPDSKDPELVKEDYPTKPASEWSAGDKGIVRGQNEYDEHHFPIGSEITFVEHSSSTRGRFEGNWERSQTVELELVEPISTHQETLGQAARLIIGDEMASSQPRQVLYYQDGDSKEMTLIGYFQSKPVLGYIDRWDDPQVFIGKESLMTEIE